ncbi:MAG: glycine cleavage system protein GcvH [bacterium]|nr:glycine cleavage system protein GcvH [bacterium]
MAYVISKNRNYTKTHEWCLTADHVCLVGISDYAQSELGDIVLVDFKVSVGQEVKAGDVIATIEAVKTVSDVYAPVSGTIKEINSKLADDPSVVNQDAYGDGWLLKISAANYSECDALLKPDEYENYISSSH